MRSWHIFLLVILILGVILGTLMAKSPGYVLISYGGITFQTSFWVMLVLLFLLCGGIYFILRATNVLMGTSQKFKQWRRLSGKNKSSELTMKGLLSFQEGNFEQAERDLIGGARQSENVTVNYISAARAANAMGDNKKREQFLRMALKAAGTPSQAIQFAKAEMAYERTDYQTCIDSLKDCVKNRVSVSLLQKAYTASADWDALNALLPDITRVLRDDALAGELRKQIALGKLSAADLPIQAAKTEFGKFSKAIRKDAEVVSLYVKLLVASNEEQGAEEVIRHSLKDCWRSDLVKAYAELGPGTIKNRLKHAHSWLRKHDSDIYLLNCLGRLHLQVGNTSDARNYFEKSLALEASQQASEQLGHIFSEEGNLIESNRYLKQAIRWN